MGVQQKLEKQTPDVPRKEMDVFFTCYFVKSFILHARMK